MVSDGGAAVRYAVHDPVRMAPDIKPVRIPRHPFCRDAASRAPVGLSWGAAIG